MRESLQVMYKINRDKTVCEGLIFLLWCFVFFFVVSAVRALQRVLEIAGVAPTARSLCALGGLWRLGGVDFSTFTLQVNEVDLIYSSNSALYSLYLDKEIP